MIKKAFFLKMFKINLYSSAPYRKLYLKHLGVLAIENLTCFSLLNGSTFILFNYVLITITSLKIPSFGFKFMK